MQNKKNLNKIVANILSFIVIFSAVVVFAQEAGHGGEEKITFLRDWLPRLINFAIIAAIIIYFARKPVRDFFKNRSAEIAKSIQESREARERAIAALTEMERKLKDVAGEANRMIEEARGHGERDKQTLIEEGRKIAQDIQAQVKSSIDLEVQKAKTALAVEAALLSIDLAEGTIKEKMNKQDHERILKEYIDKVGGRG